MFVYVSAWGFVSHWWLVALKILSRTLNMNIFKSKANNDYGDGVAYDLVITVLWFGFEL